MGRLPLLCVLSSSSVCSEELRFQNRAAQGPMQHQCRSMGVPPPAVCPPVLLPLCQQVPRGCVCAVVAPVLMPHTYLAVLPQWTWRLPVFSGGLHCSSVTSKKLSELCPISLRLSVRLPETYTSLICPCSPSGSVYVS